MASTSDKKKANTEMNPVSLAYLISYNVAQVMGWSAILLVMVSHLLREKDNRGLYDAIAPLLNIFQTAAVLEIVHCSVGLVRSNVVLTAFQVFSRVFLTWGIVYSVEAVQDIFGVVMFMSAWTITEIIRYSFYVFALIGQVPYIIQWCRYSFYVFALIGQVPYVIQWCRYTLFIVLYPIGVTGELLCILNSLDYVRRSKLYSVELPNSANMSFSYYYYLIFVMLSYIPVFPQLYMHMLAQRKKVIGGQTKSKED